MRPGTDYDVARPLDKFLYTHVINRLKNLRRNKFKRTDSPCKNCPFWPGKSDPEGCNAYADKQECDKFVSFQRRNDSKVNIVQPIHIESVNMNSESNMFYVDSSFRTEMIDIINEELDPKLRGDFLRMLDGATVNKVKKEKVKEAILEIFEKRGIDYGEGFGEAEQG